MAEPITEHATEYAGGSMLVWNEADHVTRIFPTAYKIRGEQQHGGTVWTRTIIVVEGWSKVPRA